MTRDRILKYLQQIADYKIYSDLKDRLRSLLSTYGNIKCEEVAQCARLYLTIDTRVTEKEKEVINIARELGESRALELTTLVKSENISKQATIYINKVNNIESILKTRRCV